MIELGALARTTRDFIRRHERRMIVVYIGVLVLGGGALAATPVREWALGKAESAVLRWDDRWIARVEYGERLTREQRYLEAVSYLEKLDRDFPAQYVKLALDRERQRLLRALGASYTALGKKTLALATYERLVAFDPKDFRSLYELGAAATTFQEHSAAVEAYKAALLINPTHLPSLRGWVARLAWNGEFEMLNETIEAYLDAYLTRPVIVSLGEASGSVQVLADGRFHGVEVRLTQQPGWSGALTVSPGGFAAEIDSVSLVSPMRVGELGSAITRLTVPDAAAFTLTPSPETETASEAAKGAISVPVPVQSKGVSMVRFRVRLRKPIDPDLWDAARKSFTNKLQFERLADAQRRSFVVPAAVADALNSPQ
jgi:tetratricopeptide (TPR) repeat protein